MGTRYRCPVTTCAWFHVDHTYATPPLPGWEAYTSRELTAVVRHLSEHLLPEYHLELSQVLYAHLHTHTPYEWLETLNAARALDVAIAQEWNGR